MSRNGQRLVATLGLMLASGCVGAISQEGKDESGAGGSSGSPKGGRTGTGGTTALNPGSGGSSGPVDTSPTCSPKPARAPLRMLTPREYDNTVRDVFGMTTSAASDWLIQGNTSGYDNDVADQSTSIVQVQQHQTSAGRVADHVAANLAKLLPCASAANDACAGTFIDSFGRRTWRRPLVAAERTRLLTRFSDAKVDGFPEGIRAIVGSLLMSPHFLYKVEIAGARLSPFEIATRLSYLLWESAPDDALLNAAASGKLAGRDQIATEARRMLTDARARAAFDAFTGQWLELETIRKVTMKDTKLYPNFTPTLPAAMLAGTRAFVEHVAFDSTDGSLTELLTAPYGFATADTAKLLGASNVSGTKPQRVSLNTSQRAGVLTDLTFLAGIGAKIDGSAPVLRGKFVREQLLCTPIAPPPPDIMENVPAPTEDSGLTTRERFAGHSTLPQCKGCHALMDGIGFGFERYDALGAYRDREFNEAIDAKGELVQTRAIDGPFDGAVELSKRLATAEETNACAATHLLRFGLGRLDVTDDACTIAQLGRAVAGDGYKLRDLLVDFATSESFLARAEEVIEGSCQ